MREPTDTELDGLLAYWEAANYLTVGQIYLQDNPLLREPLRPEHIKPRLLGHWGTSPGLNLVYAHLNRLIRETGEEVLYVAGPGHGGPALVANVYLEGTYSEIYPRGLRRRGRAAAAGPPVLDARRHPEPRERPDAGLDPRGRRARLRARPRLRRRLRQPRPAGRLRGRRRRGRDRRRWRAPGRACASSTPPATARCCRSCTSTGTRSPARPCWAGRARRRSSSCSRATATTPRFVAGDDPRAGPPRLRGARWHDAARAIRRDPGRPRASGRAGGPPALAGDRAAHAEGLDRAEGGRRHAGRGHLPRPPGAARRRSARTPSTWRCSRSGCGATGPRSASTTTAASSPELAALAPEGEKRMGATPHANGGRLLVPLEIPDPARLRGRGRAAGGRARAESTQAPRRAAARRLLGQRRTGELPPLLPRRDQLQPARRRLRGRGPLPDGRPSRGRARLPRGAGDGGALRAQLPGLARGLPADRPARAVRHLRGVRDGLRLDGDPAHQVAGGGARARRGGRRSPR